MKGLLKVEKWIDEYLYISIFQKCIFTKHPLLYNYDAIIVSNEASLCSVLCEAPNLAEWIKLYGFMPMNANAMR